MGSRYVTVVGGTAQRDFGWNIPSSAYFLGVSTEGIASSYNIAQYARVPVGTTAVWSLLDPPAGITIDAAGLLTKASGVEFSPLLDIWVSLSKNVEGSSQVHRLFTLTVNALPWWNGAPATLTMTDGIPYDFGQYAVDPDGAALTFSLVNTPSTYSIDPVTGAVTYAAVTTTVAATGVGATASVGNETASIITGTTATFTVSVSGGIVTTRKVSNNATWTGATIDGANIGAVGGNIIEFAGGTYPKITLQNFTGTSLANPITVRNKSGEVVTISGTSGPLTCRQNTYLTIDGSNGMGSWSPYNDTAAHGFRVIGTTAATMPTWYVKQFGQHKGVRYKRIEIDGRKVLQSNGMLFVDGSDVGFMMNDQTVDPRLSVNNGKWQNDDVEVYECYIHHTGSEAVYFGVNYNTIMGGGGLPQKDCRVTRTRTKHTGSGGSQLKSTWYGTNNGHNSNVYLYGGNDLAAHEYETGHGHGVGMVGYGAVRNCWIEQTRESGMKCYMDDGPNPEVDSTSPTGYSMYINRTDIAGRNKWPCHNVFELEISNNVVLRAGGTPCIDGTAQTGPAFVGGTRPTPITQVAHGITVGGSAAAKFRPKIFSNTIIDSDERGINVGNGTTTGGFVQNNIVLGSKAGAFLISFSASGITPENNVTTGTPSNIFQNYVSLSAFVRNGPNADDLHLKIAQPATGTRGTHYTANDMDGDPRGTGTSGSTAPDVGAYEYP